MSLWSWLRRRSPSEADRAAPIGEERPPDMAAAPDTPIRDEIAQVRTAIASALGEETNALREALDLATGRTELAVAELASRIERLGREQFAAATLLEGLGAELERLAEREAEREEWLVREFAEQRTALAELSQGQATFKTELLQEERLRLVGEFLAVADGLTESLRAADRIVDLLSASGVTGHTARSHPIGPFEVLANSLFRRREGTAPEPVAENRAELAASVAAWSDGLRLVERRLLGVFARAGVEPIPAAGRRFDPNCHLAVATEPSPDSAPGTIVREERRGYVGGGRVLRPAEVIVAGPATGSGDHGDSLPPAPWTARSDTKANDRTGELP